MLTDTCQKAEDDTTKITQSCLNPFSAINKSKLDKAQARRLKMPKRNRSAYFLFSMDTRAKLKNEFKDQLTPLEMQAKVSQYWRELSVDQKEIYEARAKEEKLEYLVAMDKFYSNLTPETLARSKTNRPKKPCSAYAHFVRDIKIDLKKENPKLIMQEILHIASEKWKTLPEADRLVYEERARLDKEQYMIATRRAHPVTQDSSIKKHQINQESQKPIKSFGSELDDFSLEEQKFKHVKVEQFPVKTEIQNYAQMPKKRIKSEDEQETNNTTPSPFPVKAEITEAEQELRNRLLIEQAYRLEPLTFQENLVFPGNIQGFDLNGQLTQPGFNFNQDININANYEKIKEAMMARLSYIRMVQANKSVEEAILRKIEEVKTLQAQRMAFIQNIFWTPNSGNF